MNSPAPVAVVVRIPLDLIDPGPNARGDLGDVAELAASLNAIGQQMPVIVAEQPGGRYQLVDGHRRHAAAIRARRPHLDAIVRAADPVDARRIVRQLSIESQTARFSPMAEARALHALMFQHGWTREDIAKAVGKTPSWVRDRISLVHLEPGEQDALDAGRISLADALWRLRNRREMREGRQPTPRRTTTPRTPAHTPGPAAVDGRCPTCHRPLETP